MAQLDAEWKKRNAKVIGVSVDGVSEHQKWKADIEIAGGAPVTYPIIADAGLEIAKAYDMLPAEAHLSEGRTPAHTATVRTVYIIGPDKKVKLAMTYPMTVGRNFGEILRALDALQVTAKDPIATPANWTVGQDVVIAPSVNDDDARTRFGEFNAVLPYLRMTKQPA